MNPYVCSGDIHSNAKMNSPNLDKMTAISQPTHSNAFLWLKNFVDWFKFHWVLFLRVQLTIRQHWFRQWLGAEQATSHYLKQCLPSSLTHICGTRVGMSQTFPVTWKLHKYTQQKKKRTCDSTGIFSGMEFIWLRQRYMTEISNLSEIKICLLICYCVRQVCAVDR